MRLKGGKLLLPIEITTLIGSLTIDVSDEIIKAINEKGCELLLDFTSLDEKTKFIFPLIVKQYTMEENSVIYQPTDYITGNGDIFQLSPVINLQDKTLYINIEEQ